MPTPADFLPRLCRAALRPSKEFLKTCFFLVSLHFSFASVKKMPPPSLATTMNSRCRRWTAICTARRTLPRHLLSSLQRRSLALCSSITRLQMKTLRTWVVCGPSPCISIPHIPLNRCCFILFYLLNKLVQLAICKGGSYCTATLGEPGTSQVHRSSLKVQVQVWFLLDYFGDSGIYQFLVQVAALQTGRPSPFGRQSRQESSRRNICAGAPARLRSTIADYSLNCWLLYYYRNVFKLFVFAKNCP